VILMTHFNGGLWIRTETSNLSVLKGQEIQQRELHPHDGGGHIIAMAQDKEGRIWALAGNKTSGHLALVKDGSGESVLTPPKTVFVNLVRDAAGGLWTRSEA